VDRAALDAARSAGLEIGGWCPHGRLAEDGTIPESYPLRETESDVYSERTERNVLDSDGTLILYRNSLSGGTALTCSLAKRHGRPRLVVDLDSIPDPGRIASWIRQERIRTLNVAGPRESGEPGIYRRAFHFLSRVFRCRLDPDPPSRVLNSRTSDPG